jgi:hypothetical protein
MGQDNVIIPAYNFENELNDNGSESKSRNTAASNVRGYSGST